MTEYRKSGFDLIGIKSNLQGIRKEDKSQSKSEDYVGIWNDKENFL